MPSFQQRDASDCGTACLAYVFHHYDLHVSQTHLRQKAGTDKIGTTALGLVETAKDFGMEAKGIKCTFEHLSQVGLPAIAHVLKEGKQQAHFVVVVAVKMKALKIMDPVDGKVSSWSFDDFKKVWTNVMVIMAPGLSFKPGAKVQSAFQRLGTMLVMQKSIILQAFMGAILATFLSLAGAVFVQKIVDNVIIDGNPNLLGLLGAGMVVILIVRLALGYVQSKLMLRAAQKIDATIILGYYRHLLHLPQSFFDTMRVGEINSRVSDAVQIRSFLNHTAISLILTPLVLVFSFSAMFFYSWKLAVLSLALVPLYCAIYLAADWRNRRYQRIIMERSADFSSQLVESMHAMRVIRGFRLEDTMALKIEGKLVRLLKTTWSAAHASLLIGSSGVLVTQLYSILLLWVGASLVLQSDLTVGQLMSCAALAGYVTGPIANLIGMNTAIRQALIATERLYEIIDLEREDAGGTVEITGAEATELRFDTVCFKYPGRLRTLHDISVTFKAREIAVLTGRSGCGKSTMLSLIHRWLKPDSGRIYLGGVDYTHLRLANLRKMISILPQRIELISGTLAENLAPSDPNPNIRRLTTLCRDVGLLDFVESLPSGFDTAIAESGANLSGGQRQRMALVRALYVDAPILILDEPNASLDKGAAELLARMLVKQRNQGKMIIVAAHSRRIVEIADVVVEMTDGRIAAIKQRSSENASGALATEPVASAADEP